MRQKIIYITNTYLKIKYITLCKFRTLSQDKGGYNNRNIDLIRFCYK